MNTEIIIVIGAGVASVLVIALANLIYYLRNGRLP